jgi:hypothetical protein
MIYPTTLDDGSTNLISTDYPQGSAAIDTNKSYGALMEFRSYLIKNSCDYLTNRLSDITYRLIENLEMTEKKRRFNR